jgi:hypothetical protein
LIIYDIKKIIRYKELMRIFFGLSAKASSYNNVCHFFDRKFKPDGGQGVCLKKPQQEKKRGGNDSGAFIAFIKILYSRNRMVGATSGRDYFVRKAALYS